MLIYRKRYVTRKNFKSYVEIYFSRSRSALDSRITDDLDELIEGTDFDDFIEKFRTLTDSEINKLMLLIFDFDKSINILGTMSDKIKLVLVCGYYLDKMDGGEVSTFRIHPKSAALYYADVYLTPGRQVGWLADLAEKTMLDIHAFYEGQAIEETRTIFGILPGEGEDPDRAAKVQLAGIIKSMVESASDQSILGASDQATLKEAVNWDQVARFSGGFEADMSALLETLVSYLVTLLRDEDNSLVIIEAMSPLDRMDLSRKILSVLPATKKGRKYLAEVLNVDTSNGYSNLTTEQKILARSPVHPDQFQGILKAFRFTKSTWDIVPVASEGFWGPLQNNHSGIVALLTQKANAGNNVLETYGRYAQVGVAAMLLAYEQHESELGPKNARVAQWLDNLLNEGVDWPEPDHKPAGATAKSIAMVTSLLALMQLSNELKTLSESPSITEQNLLNLAKSVNDIISAGAGIADAFLPRGNSKALARLTGRLTLWVMVAFCTIDFASGLSNASKADQNEAFWVHVATSTVAGVNAASVLFGSLRIIPFPSAFVIGLIGTGLAIGVGVWLDHIEIKVTANLLKNTHFGKNSSNDRIISAVGFQIKVLKYDKGKGEKVPKGEGFEDLCYAMVDINKEDKDKEDYARQIAILLGAMGAFGFDWMKALFIGEDRAKIQTTRKLPDYKPKSDGLDKTLLPAGSFIDIFDATHERGSNAITLEIDDDIRLPLKLTQSVVNNITDPLIAAAKNILLQKNAIRAINLNELLIPERVEVVLTLPTPAWRATRLERTTGRDVDIPRARVIVRDKL